VLLQGNGQRAIETFSATDLRNCPVARLQPWLGISVTEFKRKVAEYRASNKPMVPGAGAGADATDTGTPIAEYDETPAAAVAVADRRGSPPPMPGFLTNTGMGTRFVPTSEPIAAMNQHGEDVGLKFDFFR